MTPDDVRVLGEIKTILLWNVWVLGGVGVLVVGVLIWLLFRLTRYTRWAPTYVDMAARHGELTDCRFDRYEERQQRLETRLMWLEGVLMRGGDGGGSRTAQLLAAGLVCLLFGGFATVARQSTTRPEPSPGPPAAVPDDGLTAKGWAAMRTGDHRTAVALLEKAANAGGDPVLTLGAAAECHFYLKDYDRALELCDRLEATDPTAGRSHYVRGLVLLRQGKKDAAREQLRHAVRHGDALAATVIPQTL
jgi:tetratricopeptide (TPR) repeat protein